ncbi:hypothetical protein [Spirosoma aerophilum]
MILDIAQTILDDGMGNLANDVIESSDSKGLTKSGRTNRSLRWTVDADGRTLSGKLYGSITWVYLQKGRGPNKSEKPGRKMVEAIAEWMQLAGLSGSPWGIATNIAKYGIQVPNRHNPGGVLSDPLNVERVKKLLSPRIQDALFKEIRSTIFHT